MAISQEGQNPYIFNAAADATTHKVLISAIRWVGATATTHSCKLTDTAGNVIFESFCSVAKKDESQFFDCFPVTGIIAATLDSGKVYVYTEVGD